MKHFDYVDWLFYKEKLISEDRQIEMEKHLYNCDKCLEIFLSIIDEDEIIDTSSIISEDFTDNIMNKISKGKVKTIDKKRPNKSFINFGYYVAVASVTILLTATGFFNNIVDVVPRISGELKINRNIERPNPVHEYSEKIVDRTSKFINNIENIEGRGIRRNKNERQK